MDEFVLAGDNNNYLKIKINEIFGFPNETCHFGGYDTKSQIEIKTDGFSVLAQFYISTGEIFEFYKHLSAANYSLTGIVYFRSYEGNLDSQIKYDDTGHISVTGTFSKQNWFGNLLKFDFKSDQTYVHHTLNQLKIITDKYGDMKGIKK